MAMNSEKLYPDRADLTNLDYIFFSDLRTNQRDELKIQTLQDSYYFYMDYLLNKSTKDLSFEDYAEFLTESHLSKFFPNFKEMNHNYKTFMRHTDRCGAIILNKNETCVIGMKGFGVDEWALPSGKREVSDKSNSLCATREVEEEIGHLFQFEGFPLIESGKKFNRYLYMHVGFDEETPLRPTVFEEVEKIG